MLEARFPRIPGDMGNAVTWPLPVLYRVVKGATPESVVLNAAAGLLQQFPRRRCRTGGPGRRGAHYQLRLPVAPPAELAAHVKVPVATSSLLQVPWYRRDAAAWPRRWE